MQVLERNYPDAAGHQYEIALTFPEALDLLTVLAQTPIAFFGDQDSTEFLVDLHKLLKSATQERHL